MRDILFILYLFYPHNYICTAAQLITGLKNPVLCFLRDALMPRSGVQTW